MAKPRNRHKLTCAMSGARIGDGWRLTGACVAESMLPIDYPNFDSAAQAWSRYVAAADQCETAAEVMQLRHFYKP